MYIALGIIGGLVTVILVMHFIGPQKMHVERTVDVSVPPQKAFDFLAHYKNFNSWSPWSDKDPNMESGIKGTDGQVGVVYWWKGGKNVGHGEMEHKKLESPTLIEQELRFLKPFKATSSSYYTIKETTDGCTVAMGFNANNKFPMTVMGLFMDMEKSIGEDFAGGLARLKVQLEQS